MAEELLLEASQRGPFGPPESNYHVTVWRDGEMQIVLGTRSALKFSLQQDEWAVLSTRIQAVEIENLRARYFPPAADASQMTMTFFRGDSAHRVEYGSFLEGVVEPDPGELDAFFDLWNALNELVVRYCDPGPKEQSKWVPIGIAFAILGSVGLLWSVGPGNLGLRILLATVIVIVGGGSLVSAIAVEDESRFPLGSPPGGIDPDPHNLIRFRDSDVASSEVLADVGEGVLEGRVIESVYRTLGSYGAGGPGFFGVLLTASSMRKSEWLICALWAADEWLLLDERWLNCPAFAARGEPWEQEEADGILVGARIEAFAIIPNECTFSLVSADGARHTLTLPGDLTHLPPHGNMAPRQHYDEEDLSRAWVLSPKGRLWV